MIIRDATGATVATIKTDDAGVYRVSLPAGTYFVQTGGIEGYTTSIYNPAAAPDGVRALDAAGGLPTGQWIPAPSDEGACPRGLCDIHPEFAIDLVEGGDKTAINVSVTSCPTAASMSITPTSLPVGTPGVFYSQTLTATGGAAPYGYTVTDGALPLGLSLNSDTGRHIRHADDVGLLDVYGGCIRPGQACSTTRAYTMTISERRRRVAGTSAESRRIGRKLPRTVYVDPGRSRAARRRRYRLEVGTRPGGTLAAFETPDATPSIDIPVYSARRVLGAGARTQRVWTRRAA